jgi:hypothetical protein
MNKSHDFNELKSQLIEAAKSFTESERNLDIILTQMVEDIEKANMEKMEIFPVCHHSPASGLFAIKRLIEKRPKVIFMEMCEDFLPLINDLKECKLPVAFQSFASDLKDFDKTWSPLSVIAPLTEFSAEYQAISYALSKNSDCKIIFIDRSVDHIYQWIRDTKPKEDKNKDDKDIKENKSEKLSESKRMHGEAIGVKVGDLKPGFKEFEESLIKNAKVKHYWEWWDQYVEQPLVSSNYDTYRNVMFLIGSLFRRLKRDKKDSIEEDRKRESYMWTRMKEYLKIHKEIEAKDCIYMCGAFHSASDVKEFGIENDNIIKIPKATDTKWLYGIIPSSFSAIENQFALASGSTVIAESTWKKSLKKTNLKSFSSGKEIKYVKVKKAESDVSLNEYLLSVPEKKEADIKQLLEWCVGITSLARKNGYLASTADSIAIYQTSVLLAQVRNRTHPSPYDFQEAAVTCLEKDMVPKKRDIKKLCEILLGGDKIGLVDYGSLPPLAKNVYDRLKPIKIGISDRTKSRVLMDFNENPEVKECSKLLWRLYYLLTSTIVKPIMGQLKLGFVPQQESWDVYLGKNQRGLIELGYEGITIEQVLEGRLKKEVYSKEATSAIALKAVETSILLLDGGKLTNEIGNQAVILIQKEAKTEEAPFVYKQMRLLVQFYRSLGDLPDWINRFISEGYSSYCTLLPLAFKDNDISPKEVSSMLGFIITFGNLALSMGASQDQFIIAVKQSEPSDHAKKSLLWTAEYLLNMRTIDSMRLYFDNVINKSMLMPLFHQSITGFVASIDFCKQITQFVVELISKAFDRLPDRILIPFFIKLIIELKENNKELMSALILEGGKSFPKDFDKINNWILPWNKKDSKEKIKNKDIKANNLNLKLLSDYTDTCYSMCNLLGIEIENQQGESNVNELSILNLYPDTINVISKII